MKKYRKLLLKLAVCKRIIFSKSYCAFTFVSNKNAFIPVGTWDADIDTRHMKIMKHECEMLIAEAERGQSAVDEANQIINGGI